MKILFTGDFCPINRIDELARDEKYPDIYNNFISILHDCDLNVTNLECPLYTGNNAIDKIGLNLKADINITKILKYGNINLVTLANNHLMDYSINGLQSTLKACNSNGIDTVGAGLNLQEAHKPFYKILNGIRIAILSLAENEFSTTQGDEPGVNPLNPISNYYDIKTARQNADYVFVIVHGGHEYYQLPSPRMQETYRFFTDVGADVVIGHHTHCYSGYEIYNNKPIFYSLGNFIFDWPGKINSIWNKGYAVKFTLDNGVNEFDLYPYIQGDKEPGVRLMNESELAIFNKDIKLLNELISDSSDLESEFHKLIQSRKINYLSFLNPYTNKYLLALYCKGLLPSFISHKKKKQLLSIVRCESHRDILIRTLSETETEQKPKKGR